MQTEQKKTVLVQNSIFSQRIRQKNNLFQNYKKEALVHAFLLYNIDKNNHYYTVYF